QWVVVDLNSEKPINAVRIVWASPYATNYQVEYWTGQRALDFDAGPQGQWNGQLEYGAGQRPLHVDARLDGQGIVFQARHVTKGQEGMVTLKHHDQPD